jgi:hypothetical protein
MLIINQRQVKSRQYTDTAAESLMSQLGLTIFKSVDRQHIIITFRGMACLVAI